MEHWCELADWQCLWPGDWPPHIFLSTQRSTCGTTVDVACVVCFFFWNIICWRKIPTSRWGSDRNISKRYDLLGHLNWCFGVCPFVSTSMLVYGPIIVYCVNPHFCWSNSDSGLRLPIILALIALFCFFQGDTWGKFPDVPPAPVAGETESSSPRW